MKKIDGLKVIADYEEKLKLKLEIRRLRYAIKKLEVTK